MSNFDFLKTFNSELYEIGVKLEDDVINAPRAVTADATLFLETLVKDIYALSKNKLEKKLISFYKKIDNLYRLGVITYIYKNKLQDAYNLRNKIHNNSLNEEDEEKLAYDIHKRLYYISKKYFMDFSDEDKYSDIPDYKRPEIRYVHFDNCIICGCKNTNPSSNMCRQCNRKIENGNILWNIKNTFEDGFTKQDLIDMGIMESETVLLLNDLSKLNIIEKMGDIYYIKKEEFESYISEIDQYIEIGMLITQFYNDEISAGEIKSTLEYWKGGIKQKPFTQFYRLVNLRLEKDFEEKLCEYENIKKSMNRSSMDSLTVKEWFESRKTDFINGDINDAFILFNELLINDYFRYKRRNMDEEEIKKKLQISDDLYDFWKNHFMGDDLLKKTNDIKKYLIIKEIKKNKSLKDVLAAVGINYKEFERIYMLSKNLNDDFYKEFDAEYTKKRQKTFLRHLKHNSLNKAIRISKISKKEFHKWYVSSQIEYSDFYIDTTKILMDRYLTYRKRGWNKTDILKHMNITKDFVQSWSRYDNEDLYHEFEKKNALITSNLIKRGKLINAIKDDMDKEEAIRACQMTPGEFLEIYETSKKERSDFHIRFDEEYVANRKRLFPKLLACNDFYNAIQKCKITQKEFSSWYIKDQDRFIVTGSPTKFYTDTTQRLMNKYLKARLEGKNKPDSAKSIGLSNAIVDKWVRHVELDLYWEFKKKLDKLESSLIIEGFKDFKSKSEVSEIYDISLKTIDSFISLGRSGFKDFEEVFNLYEYRLIPYQLDKFLKSFKSKTFTKSLKYSKLTADELDYYVNLGKSGNEKFKKFYDDYIELKGEIYADAILSKKSHKIAMKNSNFTNEEFKANQETLEDIIFKGRCTIIIDKISSHKTTGTKLAKAAGISVEELYRWYMAGREGDVKYQNVAFVFELGVIMPRIMAFRQAKAMGVPKNWLHKNLKKELGSKEYSIWNRYGFIDQKEVNYIKLDGDISEIEDKIRSLLKNSEFINCCFRDEDPEIFDLMKKAISSNAKFNSNVSHMSKNASQEVSESEIAGK